ncbi:hypothetical protein BXY85_3525 [Roseivirga pacifica]|uniref:PPM-type phosphatase domain-containing protein n=1 Tax=Roseivirga pacifica TaxID=1267423 RepID=A0A1I0QI48_9BACT|nr:hypothetical protein [Roseivirga pacifica]RKQ42908.1 hypothetical protein BXY85_3525 [Roseivirga pacifica]SEW26551.1 hypothetical protein SAMN05216290_2350 [Roseivirga pacifica]
MYYLAAGTLNIKLKQDASDFSTENHKVIAICDGIGGIDGSESIAKYIAEHIIPSEKPYFPIYNSEIFQKIKQQDITGGTTLIHLEVLKNEACINYLGNGGIIHLQGDYQSKKYAENIYQYTQLLNPHVSKKGELVRYISKHSTPGTLQSSSIQVSLNNPTGDIILLFSDGINSLEVNPIITDDDGRYWRNESDCIHFILNELDKHLKANCDSSIFQENLPQFIDNTLNNLNTQNMIEDDASLGVLISDKVIQHYRSLKND